MVQRAFAGVSLVVLSMAVSGCIVVRSGMVPHSKPPLSSEQAALSVSVAVTGKVVVNNIEEIAPSMLLGAWSDAAMKAYRDSGFFSKVIRAPADADLTVEIDIVDSGKGSTALVYLSAFTCFLIPATASDELAVSTVFKDRSETRLAEYRSRERVTLWMHLLLVLVMPFFPPSDAAEALGDLYYDTLQEARRAGVI